jgi:hypothetical protein
MLGQYGQSWFALTHAVSNQVLQPLIISHQLSAIDERQGWQTIWNCRSGFVVGGKTVEPKFWRFGIPQFWSGYIPGFLGSGLVGMFSPVFRNNPSLIRSITSQFLGSLAVGMIWHPLKVAQLHYHCLPTQFNSTLHALIELYQAGPYYLWIGLPEAILSEFVKHFVTDILVHQSRKLWPKYPFMHPLNISVSFFINLIIWYPFRMIATQSFAQTPFFRAQGAIPYSSSFVEHVKQIWTRYGLIGFYKGAFASNFHLLISGLGRLLATRNIDKLYPGLILRPNTGYLLDALGMGFSFITLMGNIEALLPSPSKPPQIHEA